MQQAKFARPSDDWYTSLGGNPGDTDLSGANLERANIQQADLRGAYLVGANLIEADLGGADLRGANLVKVGASMVPDTSKRDFGMITLYRTKLCNTNLRGVDLMRVDLRSTFLDGATFK